MVSDNFPKDLKDLKDLKDPSALYCWILEILYCDPKGRRALLRVPSTVERSVCLCWALSKPKGPKGSLSSVAYLSLNLEVLGIGGDDVGVMQSTKAPSLVSRSRSFTAIRKDAGLCCGSRLRKGEVFSYVRLPQNLKDLKAGKATKPGESLTNFDDVSPPSPLLIHSLPC